LGVWTQGFIQVLYCLSHVPIRAQIFHRGFRWSDFLFCFWWDWGLSSPLCTCKSRHSTAEQHLQSILLCLFWRWRPHKLFVRVGLQPPSSWSQPPKWLELQAWATNAWLICFLFCFVFLGMGGLTILPRLTLNSSAQEIHWTTGRYQWTRYDLIRFLHPALWFFSFPQHWGLGLGCGACGRAPA
jgi:hypothetical protein